MRFVLQVRGEARLIKLLQTTAHTLSFTLGLLALYPDIQEKLFNHIKQIIPDGRRPVSATAYIEVSAHSRLDFSLTKICQT